MNAFVRYVTMGVYKLFYNFHIEGVENIPQDRALVMASNHRSYADPVILDRKSTRLNSSHIH